MEATVTPTIFISYRHEEPTSMIARRLYQALVPASEVWGAELFMDRQAIEPAGLFDEQILGALDRTTHFIVLLTNSYWASDYCRMELAHAMRRFEKDRLPRPLFVMVEELDPAHFTFARDRKAGRLAADHPIVNAIGDVQFLGPFNQFYQLERLQYQNLATLGDQLYQLVREMERVMPKREP